MQSDGDGDDDHDDDELCTPGITSMTIMTTHPLHLKSGLTAHLKAM